MLSLAMCEGFGRSRAAEGAPPASLAGLVAGDKSGQHLGHAGACIWAAGVADATPGGRASRLLDHALSYKISENHEFPLVFDDFISFHSFPRFYLGAP